MLQVSVFEKKGSFLPRVNVRERVMFFILENDHTSALLHLSGRTGRQTGAEHCSDGEYIPGLPASRHSENPLPLHYLNPNPPLRRRVERARSKGRDGTHLNCLLNQHLFRTISFMNCAHFQPCSVCGSRGPVSIVTAIHGFRTHCCYILGLISAIL